MIKSKYIISASITCLMVGVFVLPIFAQGKSNQPPGLLKKEDKAVLGNVEKVTGNTVMIEDKQKNKVEIITDSQTKILGQDKKILKISEIKPKDKIAVVATDSAEATDSGKPKKAVKVFVREATESAQMKRHAVFGIITGINEGVITLVHQIQQDRFYSVLFNNETVVKLKGVDNATTANLALGQRIAAVGTLNEDGMLLAKRIHVIPGKAIGVFKKQPTATPSASPTPLAGGATPSATPTLEATPSATPTLAL